MRQWTTDTAPAGRVADLDPGVSVESGSVFCKSLEPDLFFNGSDPKLLYPIFCSPYLLLEL